jgi:hypothetical protein
MVMQQKTTMKQIERVAYAAKSAGSTFDVQENKSDVIYVRIIGFVWSRLGWHLMLGSG